MLCGKWVQTTHLPTPLGVIFHNTDLNHAGYSLGRSSVPLCEGVDESAERICFLRQRKNFIWEKRDFNVKSKAVLDYIENVVLFGRENEKSCEEVMENLPNNFVLYNIWCFKLSRWHLGTMNREEACVYGTGYATGHMDEATKGSYLFDTKDECCAAYSEACQSDVESNEQNQNISFGEMALFHAYRKNSRQDEASSPAKDADAATKKDKNREKKEWKARRKQRKAQMESGEKDRRSSARYALPLQNDQEVSSEKVADRATLFKTSEQKKKERRARRKKRNRNRE